MHAILEYIGVTLIIVIILFSTIYAVNASTTRLSHIKEEQLYTVAERLMDKIILTPGYPYDWGYNFSLYNGSLTDFGLAEYGSRTPYQLDPEKILRLTNLTQLPNPLYISGEEIAELLGIKEKYFFILEMKPLISIYSRVLTYVNLGRGQGQGTSSLPEKIEVTLTNYYGVNIAGANVTGIYILVWVKSLGQSLSYNYYSPIPVESNITWFDGKCILDFSEELDNALDEIKQKSYKKIFGMVLIHVNWHGFVSIGYSLPYSLGDIVEGYVIGNYLIVNYNVTIIPRAAILIKDEVLQAVPECRSLLQVTAVEIVDENNTAYRVINSGAKKYRVYRLEYVEKLATHIIMVGTYTPGQGGRRIFLLPISRMPMLYIRYGTYGELVNAVNIVRIAYFFNYPYIVRLTLWRKEEG